MGDYPWYIIGRLLTDGKVQLEVKQAALEKSLAQLDKRLPKNEFVRIENGELILTPLDEEETEIRKEHPLAKKIGALLPPVQLGQLLAGCRKNIF